MTNPKEPKPRREKRANPRHPANPTTSSFQISDELWEVLTPLLPHRVNTHPLAGGRPRVPDRTCANGIFYLLRILQPLQQLSRPEPFPWQHLSHHPVHLGPGDLGPL